MQLQVSLTDLKKSGIEPNNDIFLNIHKTAELLETESVPKSNKD